MIQSKSTAASGNNTGSTTPAAAILAVSDAELFDELRRRGYNGRLRYTKIVTV